MLLHTPEIIARESTELLANGIQFRKDGAGFWVSLSPVEGALSLCSSFCPLDRCAELCDCRANHLRLCDTEVSNGFKLPAKFESMALALCHLEVADKQCTQQWWKRE